MPRVHFHGMLADIHSALADASNHIDERAEEVTDNDIVIKAMLTTLSQQIDAALRTVGQIERETSR